MKTFRTDKIKVNTDRRIKQKILKLTQKIYGNFKLKKETRRQMKESKMENNELQIINHKCQILDP